MVSLRPERILQRRIVQHPFTDDKQEFDERSASLVDGGKKA